MSLDAHEHLVLTLSLAEEMVAFCLALERRGAKAIRLDLLRPWPDRLPDAIPEDRHFLGFCRTFCSGGRAEAVAPVGGRDEAARAAPRAAAVRPALPSASPSGRVWSRCRRSRPPRVHDAAANAVHPRRGRGRRGPPLGACATRGWREGTGRRAIAGPGAACARVLAASWAALPALGSGSGTPGRPSACGSHRWAACSARSAVRRTAMV